MRLIDADNLMPLFIQMAYTIQDKHGVKIGENWLLNYDEIKEVIDNAPTVETSIEHFVDLEKIKEACKYCKNFERGI